MKAIKNMKGFIRSLKSHSLNVQGYTQNVVSLCPEKGYSDEDLKDMLRNIYLKTHRVSYLNVSKRCDNNYNIEVSFY